MPEHKLHYFDFYFQRFIASTKGWSDEEVGAYVKLLIEQADRGFIPEDPMELSRLITSYKKNWPLISRKFKAGENPGELQNRFMIDVRNAAIKKIEANAQNGKKGGRPKKPSLSDGKATGLVSKTDGLTTENPTPNPTETQPKAIPVTSNQYPVTIDTTPTPSPVGIDKVVEVAGEVWANQRWVENTCMGQQITPEALKKWMAQFNASICNDVHFEFDKVKYQKLFGGWLNYQKSKGYSLKPAGSDSTGTPQLKKIS